MAEPTFDHERLDVYGLSIAYVAFPDGIARTLAGLNRLARDQWLRAAQSNPVNIGERPWLRWQSSTSTSTAMLSTSTRSIPKPDEQSVERERAITLILTSKSNAPAALTQSFAIQSVVASSTQELNHEGHEEHEDGIR